MGNLSAPEVTLVTVEVSQPPGGQFSRRILNMVGLPETTDAFSSCSRSMKGCGSNLATMTEVAPSMSLEV